MSDIQKWLYQGMAAGMGDANLSGPTMTLFALAFVFGAVHAFMPGHGKSVFVSYYMGQRARVIAGLFNAAVLVFAHVGSAVILVLAGMAVVRLSLGPSRQAQLIETASALLILSIGLWLLWKALRPHRHHPHSGPVLAFVTGLVPCPLTTFIMTYSVVNGVVALGLMVVGTMALGMVATISGFAMLAIVMRERLGTFIAGSQRWRYQVARGLEVLGAAGVIAVGTLTLAT